jgi:hypothetical protein
MDNGSLFGTEEIMLIYLHRMVFPRRYWDMTKIYGRDWTALSRAFNWFNKYLRTRFGYLLTDALPYWKSEFEYCSEQVRKKVEEKSEGGIIIPAGTYRICLFYDDTMVRTCRPGGGPAEEGENATRWNTLIQGAFYSGYKKCHGIKYQSLELPNGMCADLFGPCSFR